MAELQQLERFVELNEGLFSCSVCLDLLKDPVTIHCGHSYCRGCIDTYWDQGSQTGKFSCPQCREAFGTRPALRGNNMLAEVVEKLQKTRTPQASLSAALTCAGPGDVACDFCRGTKPNKATMSCLTCLVSYCPNHLWPHYSVPVLKTHRLVSAEVPLQNKMCTKHNKLMEIYCLTDEMCICYLCTIDEHSGHYMVSAAQKRAWEQIELIANQRKVQARFRERQEALNELVQALKDFKWSVKNTVKSCDNITDEVISSIKKNCSLVKEIIKAREKSAVAQAEELQLQLEEEINKLSKRDTILQQLSEMDDDIHFIQTFQCLSPSCESLDLPTGAVVSPRHSMRTVTDYISELRAKVENLLKDTWPRISATVSTIDVVLPPVPKVREEFLRYSCPLTLDMNSAYKHLFLSEDGRRVCSKTHDNYYAYHSDRFTSVRQVLCKEGLSERCYWEVTLSCDGCAVAVSYKDISRTSCDSEFGKNKQSWSLECSPKSYTFQHNSLSKEVSGPHSSRIGIYLDHKAGTLSFYSISEEITLLHKEHTSFTQPLHPGFRLNAADRFSCRSSFAEVMKIW